MPGGAASGRSAAKCAMSAWPVAEEHLDHVGDAAVDVVLHEVQPVAHGEQLAQRDGVAGVAPVGPLGHVGRSIEVEPTLTDEQARPPRAAPTWPSTS